MQRKKNTTPSRQASGVAAKSNHRLSQEEWDREWDKSGPMLVALLAAVSILATLIETGVAL